MRKLTASEFISKAINKHNNQYIYTSVDYVNSKTKVTIICPTHGAFDQIPNSHLYGQGCPGCGSDARKNHFIMDRKEVIDRFKSVHGKKFDYTLVEYDGMNTKVIIVCPKHGRFKQVPGSHLTGRGCSKCSKKKVNDSQRKSLDNVIKDFQSKHGKTYDYHSVKYVNDSTKVIIHCPEHGEFDQTPNNHLNGQKCPGCSRMQSTGVTEVKAVLDNLKIPFVTEESFNNSVGGGGRGMSFDLYCRDHNLLIEVDGEQHYYPSHFYNRTLKEFRHQIRRDILKNKYCRINEINLLRIPEWDWNKKHILKEITEVITNKEKYLYYYDYKVSDILPVREYAKT